MRKLSVIALALLLVAGVSACGDDDDGSGVRDASDSGSGSEAESGSESGGEAACEEVGDPESASESLDVTLDSFSVTPAADSVTAGDVAFNLTNDADVDHEFVVVQADSADDLPESDEGGVDLDQLDDGALIGEVEPFPGGSTCAGAFTLDAGHYVLFCNLADHFSQGMHAEIDAA